jgi:hypothetical protein
VRNRKMVRKPHTLGSLSGSLPSKNHEPYPGSHQTYFRNPS